jgi:hypothetical protein
MNRLQLLLMALALAFALWLAGAALRDQWWASRPIVAAFYAHDQLGDPHDENGMFRSPAFDRLVGLDLTRARGEMEKLSFACEPLDARRDYASCYYGYETETGCCRFRIELHFDKAGRVTRALGDKTGLCPR